MATATKNRDVACLANCLLCDSYFMMVLATVPPAKGFRGRNGRKEFEDLLEKKQDEIASKKLWMLPCPTCAELVHGVSYLEFVSNRDLDAAISPCRLRTFDEHEPPPLYMNNALPEKKPKWGICQGLGPPALTLDKTISGRVYKPTLKQFGICEPMFDVQQEEGLGQDEFARMLQLASDYVSGLSGEEEVEFLEAWVALRPVYKNWREVSGVVEVGGVVGNMDRMDLS